MKRRIISLNKQLLFHRESSMNMSRNPILWIVLVSNILGFFGLPSNAFSGNLYFDTEGVTKTWDDGVSDWARTGDGPFTEAWVGGSAAVFNGTAGTVTVGTVSAVSTMTFNSTGYTLTGGTITLGGLISANAASTTIESVLAGTAGISKMGSGTLTLSGENTISGQAWISQGTLRLGNSNALQNGNLNVFTANGGNLSFGTLTSASIAGFIKGAITLNNENNENVTLLMGGNNQDCDISGTLYGTGSLRKVGDGTLTVSTYQPFTGETIISGGTLAMGSGGHLQNSTLNLDGGLLDVGTSSSVLFGGLKGTGNQNLNCTLNVGSNSQSTSYSGVLSGSMRLYKTGSGTLTLGGENTFTGETWITKGMIKLGASNALQNSNLNIFTANGGALTFGTLTNASVGGILAGTVYLMNDNQEAVTLTVGGNNQSSMFGGTLQGPGSLRKTGSGTLTITSNQPLTGETILSGGVLELKNVGSLSSSTLNLDGGSLIPISSQSEVIFAGLKGSGNLTLNTYALRVGANGQSTTYSGVLSGSMGLNKAGSGTLTLSGENQYTGDTMIWQGMICLEAPNALQFSHIDTSKGGILSFGTLTSASIGGLRSGTLWMLNNSKAPVDLTVGLNDQNVLIGGQLQGSGALRKLGSGTITFTAQQQSFTGETVLSGGVLIQDNYGALQSSTLNLDGGTLGYNTQPIWVFGGLKGTGNAKVDGIVDIRRNGQATTYSGVLSGTMSLYINGGQITLNGENTFTGDTFINLGKITLGVEKALQNSTVQQGADGGQLKFGALTSATLGGLGGVGPLSLLNDNLQPVTVTAGGNNLNTTYQGMFTDTGFFRKVGSGTLTLTGSSSNTTQNADFILSQGTVAVGGNQPLRYMTLNADGGTLSSTGSAILYLGGLKGSGNLKFPVIPPNLGLDVGINNLSTTYGGSISGLAILAKRGSGTLTLSGENQIGDIQLVQGTIKLGTSNALQGSTLVYTSSNGNLSFGTLTSVSLGALTGNKNLSLNNGNSEPVALTLGGSNLNKTYSGILSGPGSLTKIGTGTQFVGNGSYVGNTTVYAGILSFTGSLTNSGSDKVFLSANGTSFGGKIVRTVGVGSSFAGMGSTAFGEGTLGSSVDLLDGLNTAVVNQPSMQWRARYAEEIASLLASDVLNLSGMVNSSGELDVFTLQLTYDPTALPGGVDAEADLAAAGSIYLATNPTTTIYWENAVLSNVGTNDIAFMGVGATPDGILGHYGVNTTTHTVWAVLDHNSEYAVAVPEPGMLGLLAAGFAAWVIYWRKRR
jgi:fibronectin-binding autotransporter adhesin